jgi:hypothetical protein
VIAEPVYGCGVAGQVTVTLDVASLTVKVAELELAWWFASPG